MGLLTLMALLNLGGSPAISGEWREDSIASVTTSHRFQACTYWRPTNNGTYACSSFPQTVQVPDYYDMVHVLQKLNDRIKALENKIQILESR